MAVTKLTIDLTDKNKESLEKIKSQQRIPYGTTINDLIESFCTIPDSVKKELLNFIKPKLKDLYRQIDGAGDYNFKELSEKIQAYINISTFLNDRQRISINTIDTTQTMIKTQLKDGYLICPENYIILNPEEACSCPYAGVIECRNSDKYNIPHLLFFSTRKYSRDYDSLYQEHILSMCCNVYPRFRDIIDMQVTPIDDPDDPIIPLNAKEWMNAPTIGFFAVYVQDDPAYSRNYEPAHGTRIIRTT